MTLNIRPATIEDATIATALLVETNGGFGVEVLGFGNPDLQFSALKQWFVDTDNRFSYQCCSIAEKYGIAAGLLLAIPGSRLDSLQFGCVRRLFTIYGLIGGLRMIWVNKSMAGNKEAEENEYLIAHLGVDEHFRRQGIAQALLAKAEQDAHALNFSKLVLDVEMNNDKAIALYQKSGFVKTDTVYYGNKAKKFKSPGYFKNVQEYLGDCLMIKNSGHDFMVNTRYDHLSASHQEEGKIPQPPLELPLPDGAKLIPLPTQEKLSPPSMDLRSAIETRRTIRKYNPMPLTLEELAYLLWVSQGVKHVSSRPATARTVPSAGARHAFETYLLINRVQGLEPGLYRYMAIEQGLVNLNAVSDIAIQLKNACHDQVQLENCAAAFIWVAVVERMFWRYVERGYRYLHLDAGHVCQNLALGAEQIGGGICPIAAFDDVKLNSVLGLDGESMFVVYLATVGKKV